MGGRDRRTNGTDPERPINYAPRQMRPSSTRPRTQPCEDSGTDSARLGLTAHTETEPSMPLTSTTVRPIPYMASTAVWQGLGRCKLKPSRCKSSKPSLGEIGRPRRADIQAATLAPVHSPPSAGFSRSATARAARSSSQIVVPDRRPRSSSQIVVIEKQGGAIVANQLGERLDWYQDAVPDRRMPVSAVGRHATTGHQAMDVRVVGDAK